MSDDQKTGELIAKSLIVQGNKLRGRLPGAKRRQEKSRKALMHNPFVTDLEHFINTFEAEHPVCLGSFDEYRKEIIVNFIKARTRIWIDFFKRFVIEDQCYYNGDIADIFEPMEAVMSYQVNDMGVKLRNKYDIPDQFIKNFERYYYSDMYNIHRKHLHDMLMSRLFHNAYVKWDIAFIVYKGSILNMNRLILHVGNTLFEGVECPEQKEILKDA